MEERADFAKSFRAFMDAMVREAQDAGRDALVARLADHLGTDPAGLAIYAEEFEPFERPNLQVALNTHLARAGVSHDLVGVALENKRYMGVSLSDLMAQGAYRGVRPGPVDYVNFHLAGGEVLACVQYGMYLVTESGSRLAAFVAGPSDHGGPRVKLRIEVSGPDGAACQRFLESITELMRERNVYRGHTISVGPSPIQFGPTPQTLVQFLDLPQVPRSGVVLPEDLLHRIERHAIGFSGHAEQLLAAGRSLKRGMLLYGPPGTGKTLTVMYLAAQMPGRTVVLTTGRSMGLVTSIAQLARTLAPATVVLEDVDLIAEERGNPFRGTGPLLFELLNEMDGLRDDADVMFVLTTNRPDILEPALAARPGRVDLAVELPMPDAGARQRLIELYSQGLTLEGIDLPGLVERVEGATPAYLKELLRKAALAAAERGDGSSVGQADIDEALAELAEGGRLAERLLGFKPDAEPPRSPLPPGPLGALTGFPPAAVVTRIPGQ